MVDEGQDFHELWWTSLESVFRDPHDKGCYYVFFDPNQNLYVQEPCLPEEFGKPYLLQEDWSLKLLRRTRRIEPGHDHSAGHIRSARSLAESAL